MLPPVSVDSPEVAVSALSVSCDIATAGAAMPNIPPMIAKAATTAESVVLIKQSVNTIDLKDVSEISVISFASHYDACL
jgi:hypothetical protein